MAERVLVIDDSSQIRDFLVDNILQPRGFETITAVDGWSGIEAATTENPDLLIVDMQMPQMTGLELLRELDMRHLKFPAILMTAYGSEETAVEAFRLGVRDYVIKPFGAEEILVAIERALRESRLQNERDQLVHQLRTSNIELQRRVQELNMLYGIGKSVSSSLDLEQVLHKVVDAVVYLTRAEEGYLMLLDETQGSLYMRASKNLDFEARSMKLPIRDSLAGQVMQSKRPLMIGDKSGQHKIKTSYLVTSLIYVPLIVQDKAIGVLGVANRSKQESFDHQDQRILMTLADYAAVAIQNATLYGKTQQRAEELAFALAQHEEVDRLKSEFTQNVSHELRTPLAIILGYVELLRTGVFGPINSEQGEPLEVISRRVHMLRKLLDDFNAMLVTDGPKWHVEKVDMGQMVKTSVADFQATAAEENLILTADISPNLVPVSGDSAQLRRVLDNLIGNAIKFTPNGGSIIVRLSHQDGHLVLEVVDTGIGIPSEEIELVSQRFYQVDKGITRRYSGTGLGLALVKEITEAHGGLMSVESTPGEGSTFQIRLPVTPERRPAYNGQPMNRQPVWFSMPSKGEAIAAPK